MSEWDHETDLLVIGSGAGAVGALRAAANGKRALVVEKTELFGGSTAMSGGVVWMPDNPLMRREGVADSRAEGLTYFDSLVGDAGPASSPARRETYLDAGNEMIAFLEAEGVELIRCPGMSDYYAGMRGVEGGSLAGRSLEPKVFDRKKLGKPWRDRMRPGFSPGINIYTGEAAYLQAIRSTGGFRTAVRVGFRTAWGVVSGKKYVTNGEALMARVLHALLRRGVPVWLEAAVTELVVEDGRVVGAVVRKRGRTVRVRAHDGVLIASGGFARNAEMRQEVAGHVGPMTDGWTSANPGDTGEIIQQAMALGAATDMLDEAWWMPTWFAGDDRMMCMSERSKPHSMIVDARGERFFNESVSYQEAGQRMYARERETGGAIPAWLIIDTTHRRRYTFLMAPPGMTPKKWLKSGWKKADTIEGLADACGIDRAGLRRTVERFNGFAATGVDEDFHRGEGGFEQFYGDPDHGPNKCLGPITKAPFYAIALYPGDIGTSGGLLTDEHARVLREDSTPIEGLYATGNATASVMGRSYPGAGATIAASAVFGYVAADHAAR